MNEPHIWWYVTRSSAIIAWVLLTVSVVWGILLSTRVMRKIDNPAWLKDLHRYLGGAAIGMVVLHMVTLMLDGWLQFTPAEVLIPFATDFRPLPVALGIIAFYLLLIVQGTSLLMDRLPRAFWKVVHYSSYITLVLVSLHAGLTGTDVGALWYRVLSVALIGIATVAVVMRIAIRPSAKEARKHSAAASGQPAFGARSRAEAQVAASTPSNLTATMVVASSVEVASGVLGIRLVPLGGGALPSWQAGSHITLHLPEGMQRQYSLCGDPAERHHFDIAVLRTTDSTGGSSWIHDSVVPGMTIEVSGPLNHFVLEPAADYLFIAGGIGITPIAGMIESLPPQRTWRLVYLGRSRSTMAFVAELAAKYPGRVQVLASDETIVQPDAEELVAGSRAEVYCCGPESLMAAVAAVVPAERMHFERFIPLDRSSGVNAQAVDVVCSRSGKEFRVGATESILDALESNGVPVVGSCRKGVCGACEVRVSGGTPQHLDSVMGDGEKDDLHIMYPCVSRSLTPQLVLDV